MNRREFLKGAGAISVVAAGGGVWYAHDRGVWSAGQGPAYEPWTTWRTDAKGPLELVRAAILASNPHNTQPLSQPESPSARSEPPIACH